MSRFLDALDDHVVLGDGAMGTEILARGIPLSRSFDELNVTQPDLVRSIHQAYCDAGAELIETNTFTSNRLRLAKHRLESKARGINIAAARLARGIAGGGRFVAGSVGPLTDLPCGADEKAEAFREQCEALAEGGCDALILETFTDPEELMIAVGAGRPTGLPVICQMAFLGPVSVEQSVRELEGLGADVIGVNCTVPDAAVEVLTRMAGLSKARLSAFPNAGLLHRISMTTPEQFARIARKLADLGVRLVGGCCGIGPEHIRAAAASLRGPA